MKTQPMTIKCPKCGNRTSMLGDFCEHCGCHIRKSDRKKPFYKKWWFWLIIAGLAFGGLQSNDDKPDKSTTSIVQEVVEDSEEPSDKTTESKNESNTSIIENPQKQEEPKEDTSTQDEQPEDNEPVEDPATEEPEVAPEPEVEEIPVDSSFEIHFLDVGQADAAIVLCDGKAMLIDGGNSADSSLIFRYLQNHDVAHLDYMVATHGHEDHVGGLSGALVTATVGTAYCSVSSYDTDAFENFVEYLDQQGKEITIPKAGDTFNLGSASVQIVGVNGGASDHNDSSIILRIVYGSTSFLFTGDAEREAEQAVLNAGYNIESTVLKVGHHGSADSTGYVFLREVMPQYAVVSVGKDNSYGHPTEEALSRLRDADVKVFRTDLQGTIICTSDGSTVSFSVSKNADADTLAPYEKEPVNEPTPTPTPTPTPDPEPEPQPEPESEPDPEPEPEPDPEPNGSIADYVGNKNSKKFHYDWCGSVKKMSEKNKFYYTGTRDEMIAKGYEPCKNCNP